jgi:hypothetical protein
MTAAVIVLAFVVVVLVGSVLVYNGLFGGGTRWTTRGTRSACSSSGGLR